MIEFDKAFQAVMNTAVVLDAEHVDFESSLNRVLAEDVISDMDMPPFDKSAMDGYACRRDDLGNELTVIETIPAGSMPQESITKNQCSKIMTGAPVPTGADCVIMKEYVETVSENSIKFTADKTNNNICIKAEDIKVGDIVLHKGEIIAPQHIAVLASVGCTQPLVVRQPKVAVIATGTELVDPAEKPGISQIRNTNAFQLAAQIEKAGASATNYGIAGDTMEQIDSVFKKALSENDVVIVSGGVSVGDFDFVPDIFKKNGVNMLFEKVAVKPGKPTVFGTSGQKFCFGLPGNPVSTFVLFEVLVKHFLFRLMGYDFKPVNLQIPVDQDIISKKAKRLRWIPIEITDSATVRPIEYHGSAHINSLCNADGLICLEVGVREIKKNTPIAVRLL